MIPYFDVQISYFNNMVPYAYFDFLLPCLASILWCYDNTLRCYNTTLQYYDTILRCYDATLRCYDTIPRCYGRDELGCANYTDKRSQEWEWSRLFHRADNCDPVFQQLVPLQCKDKNKHRRKLLCHCSIHTSQHATPHSFWNNVYWCLYVILKECVLTS